MHRRQWLATVFAVGAALVLANTALAHTSPSPSPLKDAEQGAPDIKSIEAIGFGPNGLLLLGDGKGKQIVAVETGDTTPTKWTKTEIKDVKAELAGRLGTTAKGIEIRKMAVNPASQTAYIAVRGLDAKKDLILTVDGNGKIKEFAMTNVKFVAVPLPADQKVTAITDITWAGDRVLVAAQATDTFGSKVFSVTAPLSKDGVCGTFSTETYHVAHQKWETKAPIRTIIPYEENGKKYVVGTFTCTPIVKYSLDDLQPGGKVKGTSVIELGQGNTPQDMFVYEKNGKKYILMNQVRMAGMQSSNPVGPSEYWAARVDLDILTETKNINEKSLWRTRGKANKDDTTRAVIAQDYHGVMHMDQLDATNALVVRKDKSGVSSLQVVPLP